MKNMLKKIGKALKVALLSLFNMDLQIDIEEEEDLLKVSKFKSAFILLTITTILWIIVFYTLPQYCLVMGVPLLGAWLGFIVVAIGKLSERKKVNGESVGGAFTA